MSKSKKGKHTQDCRKQDIVAPRINVSFVVCAWYLYGMHRPQPNLFTVNVYAHGFSTFAPLHSVD